MFVRLIPALALVLASAACSSSNDSGGSTTGSTSSTLKAPSLMTIAPMEGVLHVTWMNNQTDCDSVEGERMTGGSYASAFSVAGTVDNKMDMSATDDMTYMYRLRCKKGAAYSAYSNEMSGNPMQGMNMDGGMGMNMDSGMRMD